MIQSPHLGCGAYQSFDEIFAFVNATQLRAGDRFIAQQIILGRCAVLKRPVRLIKQGFLYSQVMTLSGAKYWVIAEPVNP